MRTGDLESMSCPACRRRVNGLNAKDCPICQGYGWLILGRPALLRYDKLVVSRAVEFALEAQAQKDLAVTPVNLAQARLNLTAMVVKLAKVGLLWPGRVPETMRRPHVEEPGPVPAAMDVLQQAAKLSEEASGLPYTPGRDVILTAPQVRQALYAPSDVPVTGQLPGFSAAGYLCGLAQVSDPFQSLVVRTPSTPRQEALDRAGDVLGRAVMQ